MRCSYVTAPPTRRGGSGSGGSQLGCAFRTIWLCLLVQTMFKPTNKGNSLLVGRRILPGVFVSAAAWTSCPHQRYFGSARISQLGSVPFVRSTDRARHQEIIPSNILRQSPSLQSNGNAVTRLSASPLFFADTISSGTTTTTTIKADDERRSKTTARIQILMSDTGGGHRASANALRDAFDILTSQSSFSFDAVECDIVDIYTDYAPVWPFKDYVSVYQTLAATPWMWDVVYQFGATPFGMWLNARLLEFTCTNGFTQCLERTANGSTDSSTATNARRADLVVSVHPLTQALPLQILTRLDARESSTRRGASTTTGSRTPFCTVVTDLGSAHPTWFHPGVDVCFVPSDALNRFAQQRGLQPSQIKQYGLPIRKGFWASSPTMEPAESLVTSFDAKRDLRQKLGLDTDRPVVLVVGGGDGMGGLVDISKQLGQTLGRENGDGTKAESQSQMVVVCGKNQKAKQQLDDASDQWGSNVRVIVQGFVSNMDEWMKASDVLVTKAGPGTIAEASICGLPCMMFSYLPGQEEGNIPFVQDAGFGTYSSNPAEIASTVSSWLSSPDKLDRMQKAAFAAARPQATMDIASDILSLLDQRKRPFTPTEPQ